MRHTREIMREFTPILSADITECDADYHVLVDLPGVHAEDLDVTVVNGFLHIQAERKQVHKADTAFKHLTERSFGKVQRSIPIPVGAMPDTADAKFLDGVLTVRFSKRADAISGRKLHIN